MEDHRSNEIVSKIVDTQNVIKNKFEKACANRLKHEQNVKRVINRLTPLTDNSESESKDPSLPDLSKTTNNIPQLRFSNKNQSNHVIKSKSIKTNEKKHGDPNELCDKI